MRHVFKLFVVVCFAIAPASVFAQETGNSVSAAMEQKIELAERMHEIRPARAQIDDAIDSISKRLPASERGKFLVSVRDAIDYEQIERHSIESMAEVFTVEELEAMVEFYSRPVTRNISDKFSEYHQLMQPEIVRMLDKAMMEMRTGGTAP